MALAKLLRFFGYASIPLAVIEAMFLGGERYGLWAVLVVFVVNGLFVLVCFGLAEVIEVLFKIETNTRQQAPLAPARVSSNSEVPDEPVQPAIREITMRPCPKCKANVRSDASRCSSCMEKIDALHL